MKVYRRTKKRMDEQYEKMGRSETDYEEFIFSRSIEFAVIEIMIYRVCLEERVQQGVRLGFPFRE